MDSRILEKLKILAKESPFENEREIARTKLKKLEKEFVEFDRARRKKRYDEALARLKRNGFGEPVSWGMNNNTAS